MLCHYHYSEAFARVLPLSDVAVAVDVVVAIGTRVTGRSLNQMLNAIFSPRSTGLLACSCDHTTTPNCA